MKYNPGDIVYVQQNAMRTMVLILRSYKNKQKKCNEYSVYIIDHEWKPNPESQWKKTELIGKTLSENAYIIDNSSRKL